MVGGDIQTPWRTLENNLVTARAYRIALLDVSVTWDFLLFKNWIIDRVVIPAVASLSSLQLTDMCVPYLVIWGGSNRTRTEESWVLPLSWNYFNFILCVWVNFLHALNVRLVLRVSDLLELELQTVVSHCVGSGNWTWEKQLNHRAFSAAPEFPLLVLGHGSSVFGYWSFWNPSVLLDS